MSSQKVGTRLNENTDDVIVYIEPSKRAIVTIALLVGFFGVHFYMRAFSMCTSYIMANWNAGEFYSAGKALQTAIMVVATAVSAYLIPKWELKKSWVAPLSSYFCAMLAHCLPVTWECSLPLL